MLRRSGVVCGRTCQEKSQSISPIVSSLSPKAGALGDESVGSRAVVRVGVPRVDQCRRARGFMSSSPRCTEEPCAPGRSGPVD
jgi:hypothetical protein